MVPIFIRGGNFNCRQQGILIVADQRPHSKRKSPSRSPPRSAVVAALLALEEGISVDDVLERIRGVRKEANPDPEVWESVIEYVEAKRRA
jgi:hypothetical protein